mmetsp:Transcript_16718/g.21313  ORF Transcript_16718/g.21313 Transcript_16718/m.21313 type:complete len:235 (-) Transcript_16718:84-788(-)
MYPAHWPTKVTMHARLAKRHFGRLSEIWANLNEIVTILFHLLSNTNMTRTKRITSKERLLPEYIRALEFLDSSLDSLVATPVEDISDSIWNEGSVLMFVEQFSARYIPSGENWRWNQTKSRKQASLVTKKATVNFFKLSTRKRNTNTSASIPGFKMWQFEITFQPKGEPIYVVWCEKGIKTPEVEQKKEKDPLCNLSHHEIAMLHEITKCDAQNPNDPLYFWPSNNSFEGLLCL